MKPTSGVRERIAAEQQILQKQEFAIAARNFLRNLHEVTGLVRRDLRSPVDLSLRHGIRAWRYGFTRFNYRIYGLAQSASPSDYLSDYQAIKQLRINGRFAEILNSKLVFPLWMKKYGMPTPEIKGVIRKGLFYPLHSGSTSEPSSFLKESCAFGQRLVLKPVWGWHGTGIIMMTRNKNGWQINGEAISFPALAGMISRLDNYVVTEFAVQGEYGARLYPNTTNTMRVVTFWEAETAKPFIAKALQRIGTSRSFPVDNFKAGHGGLSALIEPDSGKLGLGAMVDTRGDVTWHSEHPESQAPIQGVAVPAWNEIRMRILEYADRFAFAPCIAWDIVPTHSGFTILEGNSPPGMPVMQVHGPLLTDPRIRRFYEYHGVIS